MPNKANSDLKDTLNLSAGSTLNNIARVSQLSKKAINYELLTHVIQNSQRFAIPFSLNLQQKEALYNPVFNTQQWRQQGNLAAIRSAMFVRSSISKQWLVLN